MHLATAHLSTGIVAAGAIVVGVGSNEGKVLLVRRQRYGAEVALPKGKVHTGENEVAAAQREVLEETGCVGTVTGYAGSTHYAVDGVPKAVFYLTMQAADDDVHSPQDTGEVCGVEWLNITDALAALSHRDERALVAAVFGVKGSAEE